MIIFLYRHLPGVPIIVEGINVLGISLFSILLPNMTVSGIYPDLETTHVLLYMTPSTKDVYCPQTTAHCQLSPHLVGDRWWVFLS